MTDRTRILVLVAVCFFGFSLCNFWHIMMEQNLTNDKSQLKWNGIYDRKGSEAEKALKKIHGVSKEADIIVALQDAMSIIMGASGWNFQKDSGSSLMTKVSQLLHSTVTEASGMSQPIERIVDVGCGSGSLLFHVLPLFPSIKEALGLDYSEKLVSVGRSYLHMIQQFTDKVEPSSLEASGLPAFPPRDAKVVFQHFDATFSANWEAVPSDYYNVVYLNSILQYISSLSAAAVIVEQMLRIVKLEGGVIFFGDVQDKALEQESLLDRAQNYEPNKKKVATNDGLIRRFYLREFFSMIVNDFCNNASVKFIKLADHLSQEQDHAAKAMVVFLSTILKEMHAACVHGASSCSNSNDNGRTLLQKIAAITRKTGRLYFE